MKKIFSRLGIFFVVSAAMSLLAAGTAFAGTTPAITSTTYKVGVNKVLVEFNAPVWGDSAYTTALAASDFTFTDAGADGMISISSVSHVAGNDFAVLTMNAVAVAEDDAETVNALANNIFTVGGALSEKTSALVADTTAPTLTASALNGQAEVLVTFSERVYGEADATADLVNADFAYDDAAGGTDGDACTGTASGTVAHTAGNDWAIWTCSANLTTAADIDDNEEMDLASATSVYDVFGNAAVQAQNANLSADAGVPTFDTGFVALKAEATVGATKILVKFSEPVFNASAPTMTADLVAADLTYVDTTQAARTLTTVTPTVDQKWAVLTLSTALVVADLTDATADTVNATVSEVFDAFGQNQATTTMKLADNTDPVILSLAYQVNAGGQNQFIITYSEKVTIGTLTTASATMAASTATVGDLAAVGALEGFGDFATNGTITVPTTKNTLAIDSTQTIITVTMAGASGGYIATSTTTITVPSGVFTPDVTVGSLIADLRTDVAANDIEVGSVQSTLTTTTAWDTTRPTISSGVLSDSFANDSAFVAGGTFHTGTDGRADQVIFTASEALRGSTLTPDASTTRDDWTITAAASEYGTLTPIKAAPVTAGDTGTTFTLNFSGANLYYASPSSFSIVNTQNATPSLTDRAGNPLASGLTNETYKVCFTGLTCASSSIGNVAVITSSITQPANTADVTGPAAAKDLKAEVVEGKEVKLTWTDPTDADLSNIKIYRVKNSETETSLEVLGKGVKTYTDKAVAKGDKVKYRLSGFDTSGNEGTKTDYTTEATVEVAVVVVEEEEAAEPISVDLLAVAESGVSGTATIEEVAGKVKVTLALTGAAEGASHPAHIHMGTCAATGDIKHNLTAVADGASVTTLELTLAELQAQYPLYVNVHASDADLATTVACGNIEAETVLPEVELEGEVVEEAVAVVDGTITEAVSVQSAETGATVSIAAETMATVGGAAFTGTIAPPVVIEKEITAPEGSKAASEVFSVDTGVTGSVVFDKPVTLVFPAKGTVSTKKLYTMYTVGADGKLSEPVVCAVKTLDGKKVFECKSSHLTEFVILESEPEVVEEEEEEEVAEAPFVDTKSHWSKDFVADLYAKKVVSGKDATHYAPDAYISRAEFTKIVIVGLGISVKEAKDIKDMPFKDVKATDWALPYIDAAKTAGVIGGYKDGTFKSDAMINRAEAMKILFEAAKIETKNAAAAKFSDVKQSEWYAKYVNYAAEKKIVSGYKDGTFGTDKNLTRGEVAKIVSLLLADM